MSDVDLITKLNNRQNISVEQVFQKYYKSDNYKWPTNSDGDNHFSSVKEQLSGFNWVKGTIRFIELLDIKLINSEWASTLTEGNLHTLRYALESLHQKINAPPREFLADFRILSEMKTSLEKNSFCEDDNFVIIKENYVFDGNHRIIMIPSVRGIEASTTCFLGIESENTG